MKALYTLGLVAALAAPVLAQEIANAQAGLYPLRARISPWPAVPGKCHLIVDVDKPVEGESALAGLKLSLLMDMPATKGMRALTAVVPRKAVGHYEGDVVLSMKGTWRIQFLLATPTGEFRVITRVQVGPGKLPPGLPALDDNCGPEDLVDPNLKVTCSPNPPRVGDNHLVIQLPPDQKPQKVMLGLDMAGMPMSLVPVAADSRGSGRYEADVNLPMNGIWQLRVDLDGRVPPPILLNVNTAERRPVSQPLLWLTLAAGLPLGIGALVRKKPLAPLMTGVTLAVSTFSAGAVIERYWPPEDDMNMSSEAPPLNAPTPVLQATVQKVPLSTYKAYPAQVRASQEKILTATGVVWELGPADVAVKKGAPLARVGSALVRAPVNGVVTRRLAEPGQTLPPGSPLLAFSSVDQVHVRADVPNADRFLVRRGQAVSVLDGDTNIPGLITSVSALSQGDHFWVEASVKNRQLAAPSMGHFGRALPAPKAGDDGGRPGTLPVGGSVLLRCLVDLQAPTLCVPKEAVFESAGRKMVMVVSPVAGQQLAFRRVVTVGLSTETHSEILSGLREGETVVALAQEPLPDGTLVTAASWGVGSYRDLMIPEDSAHAP